MNILTNIAEEQKRFFMIPTKKDNIPKEEELRACETEVLCALSDYLNQQLSILMSKRDQFHEDIKTHIGANRKKWEGVPKPCILGFSKSGGGRLGTICYQCCPVARHVYQQVYEAEKHSVLSETGDVRPILELEEAKVSLDETTINFAPSNNCVLSFTEQRTELFKSIYEKFEYLINACETLPTYIERVDQAKLKTKN